MVTDAFADAGRVAGLVEALRARTDQGSQIVAVHAGSVVGFVALSISWVDAPDRLVDVLTLSPLAVAPSHQSRGIGAGLLESALTEAQRIHAPLVLLEGHPDYYGRYGWQSALDLGLIAPSPRIPSPAFQAWPLPGYDPAIMHGPVVYNDTFWAYDCVGLRPDRPL